MKTQGRSYRGSVRAVVARECRQCRRVSQDSSSDLITEGATVFLTTAEVSNLRQKAEKGDANAEYSLDILYMEVRDDTEGVKWHKAA